MKDRRPRKTDDAIRAAFLRLLFSVRYETISMSRIAAEADVSRSTLYQHYPGREAILKATMMRILETLADGMTGARDAAGIDPTLEHFWENRRLARSIFGPPVDAYVRRWLADEIEARLLRSKERPIQARVAAISAAAGAIALLEQWMSGHLDAPRSTIASALVDGAVRPS